LLANLLLRAEQGAEALLARGGQWQPPQQLHQRGPTRPWLNLGAALMLAALLGMRWSVGGAR